MEKENQNVFTAKTVEEAVELGLKTLGLTKENAEIVVLEEGKKRLFGSIKAKVQVNEKLTDGARAVKFMDGLFDILNIPAVTELVAEGDKIEIDVKTTNSHAVIGRRGEILDAIQVVAGAVANIGNEEYKRVVVDCENYRSQREKTLQDLANKLAKKAVERGRKVTLEPMNPYERRIIHSALTNNTDVKTVSDGKEPNRYIVIIPNNLKHSDKKDYKGEKRFNKDRHGKGKGERRDRKEHSSAPRNNPPKRGKKEIHFGTFLGNSGNKSES
ncbi:MAG: protein jag [Clostridia bacterium]|nr:protein jag [Clostridia bacterium]